MKGTLLRATCSQLSPVAAGKSRTEIGAAISAALDKRELPSLETGAICYMLSKGGYLSDDGGHWHPHVMFFVPLTDEKSWGAGMPGSPILASEDKTDHLTVFMVPVGKWSDGSPDSPSNHH